MASDPDPLWLSLRAAIEARGYSIRGFAKACYEADPRMNWNSWKRTINRALDEDAAKPYAPSRDTAELWARLLKKPRSHFVRPQARETIRAENARLRAENVELRRELARFRSRASRTT